MTISEIWKPVTGFVGKYEVSNLGRVKSIGGKSRLNGPSFIGAVDKMGYPATCLRKEGVRLNVRVHTLVAEAFIAKPIVETPLCVNHIDGNKKNNCVSNLEWTTYAGNSKHAIETGLLNTKGSKHKMAKLSESDVIEIRELYKTKTQRYIAELFNVGRRHLSDIITGKCWGHLPVLDYSGRPAHLSVHERKPLAPRIHKPRIFLAKPKKYIRTKRPDISGIKNHHAKLTNKQVMEIRELYITHSQAEIARMFNKHQSEIGEIIRGKTWGHLPLIDYTKHLK